MTGPICQFTKLLQRHSVKSPDDYLHDAGFKKMAKNKKYEA
jgi:hypothetical protein